MLLKLITTYYSSTLTSAILISSSTDHHNKERAYILVANRLTNSFSVQQFSLIARTAAF